MAIAKKSSRTVPGHKNHLCFWHSTASRPIECNAMWWFHKEEPTCGFFNDNPVEKCPRGFGRKDSV